MKVAFQIEAFFPVKPEEIYRAWLDSKLHGAMTGGEAFCSNKEGAEFSAWYGYITGSNQKLTLNTEIVQQWRTTEFKDTDEDSLINLTLQEVPKGTKITLVHTNIPEGQPDYKQGWVDYYFTPMKAYFVNR